MASGGVSTNTTQILQDFLFGTPVFVCVFIACDDLNEGHYEKAAYWAAAAIVLLVIVIVWVVAGRKREIESANGWSVSITTTGNSFGVFSANPADNMMAFQPFRFANVSTTRTRVLDVVIKSTWDKKPIILFQSEQDGKSGYQRAIEDKVRGDRRLNCIEFPLKIAPEQIIEGQIIIPVTDQLRRIQASSQWGLMDVTKNIRFVFREHISGRQLVLQGHRFFNASTGQATPTRKQLSPWARIKSKWRQRKAERDRDK